MYNIFQLHEKLKQVFCLGDLAVEICQLILPSQIPSIPKGSDWAQGGTSTLWMVRSSNLVPKWSETLKYCVPQHASFQIHPACSLKSLFFSVQFLVIFARFDIWVRHDHPMDMYWSYRMQKSHFKRITCTYMYATKHMSVSRSDFTKENVQKDNVFFPCEHGQEIKHRLSNHNPIRWNRHHRHWTILPDSFFSLAKTSGDGDSAIRKKALRWP